MKRPRQGRSAPPPSAGSCRRSREEHEELRESVRRFVEAEMRPHVDEWEATRWFPRELFPRWASSASSGLKYEEYGGQGGDYLHDAVLAEELARCGSGGVAAGLGAHTAIATPPVWKFGTEEQKQRCLVPAIAGEKIAALGDHRAGRRLRRRRACGRSRRPVDGGYVVNGSKTFITNGVRADFLVCAAKTTPEGGHGGISFFLVESDKPGYEASQAREARLARLRHRR